MVLAILVLGLPRDQQQKALRYGISVPSCSGGLAIVFAAHMIQLSLVKLVGGLYLLWLPYQHFFRRRRRRRAADDPCRRGRGWASPRSGRPS